MPRPKGPETKVTAVNFANASELTNGVIVERVTAWVERVSPADLAVNAAKANLAYTAKMRYYDPITFRYTNGLNWQVKEGAKAEAQAKAKLDDARAHLGDDAEYVEQCRQDLASAKKAKNSVRKSIRIPMETWKRVEWAAQVLSTSPSDIVRIAVDELFLDSGKALVKAEPEELHKVAYAV